jgi:transposase
MNVTTARIDLAKNVFSVHGVDAHGKVAVKKTLSPAASGSNLANLPPCLIGMEACSGAHHWARTLRALGHDACVIAPRFVKRSVPACVEHAASAVADAHNGDV